MNSRSTQLHSAYIRSNVCAIKQESVLKILKKKRKRRMESKVISPMFIVLFIFQRGPPPAFGRPKFSNEEGVSRSDAITPVRMYNLSTAII